MIRAVKENDLSAVMQIWLDINIKAHSFISKHYWMDNYDMVKKILPQAEIYVYENNGTKEIEGFIGLTDNYIAGLFVKEDSYIACYYDWIDETTPLLESYKAGNLDGEEFKKKIDDSLRDM